jgi:hypothetical protein
MPILGPPYAFCIQLPADLPRTTTIGELLHHASHYYRLLLDYLKSGALRSSLPGSIRSVAILSHRAISVGCAPTVVAS